MKHLTIAGAVLASAAMVCLVEHAAQQRVDAKNLELGDQLQAAETRLGQTRGTLAEHQKRWSQNQDETSAAQAELLAAENEAQSATPPEMDPAHEGAWPSDKPYFYLAKRRLKDVAYDGINESDKLSAISVALFNISTPERTAIDNAIQEFRKNINESQTQHAQKIEPAPGVNTEDHQEISFKLPGMTNEFVQLKAQFEASLTSTLGAERGGLLLDRVDTWIEERNVGDGGQEATLKLESNRQKDGHVEHLFHYERNGGNSTSGLSYPVHQWDALWQYRHLFGEQPLIPSQTD
jgi:hypothetical protein